MTKTRTGFPFHSPSFSVDTESNSKAPDNFADDANCTNGDWQAANAADLCMCLID
jgi:hypothetical protein